MHRLTLIVLLLILSTGVRAERVALVIGNSAYSTVAPLDNPRNDSAAVAAALTRQGFTVMRGDNLGRIGMRDALRRFRDLADRADIALVYYAGHGIEIGGVNYLVPVDARLEDERDAPLEMVDLDLVLRQISGAQVMKMVVLDACRNNPFVIRMQQSGSSRAIGQGLADLRTNQSDTLVAYAAAAGAITPDGAEGGNSPFTAAFLAALDGPPADVRRVLGRVRDGMRKSVPGAAPFVYSSLGGGAYVINPESAGLPPSPPPSAPDISAAQAAAGASLAEDFVRIDRDGTLAGWDGFLIRHQGQSDHPLYGFALERREALRKVARREPQGAVQDTVQTEPPGETRGEPMPTPAPVLPTTAEVARDIQRTLRASGCYRGGIDGILGRNSRRGLAAFGDAAGIEVPSAMPGDVVGLIALRSLLARHAGTECKQAPVVARPRPQAVTTPAPKAAKTPPQKSQQKPPAVRGSEAAPSSQSTGTNLIGARTRKDTTKLAPVISSDCIGPRRKLFDCD